MQSTFRQADRLRPFSIRFLSFYWCVEKAADCRQRLR
jgi:hypothetical protein